MKLDGFKFFFDVSTLEHKKAMEKREIVHEFKTKRKDGTLVFNVSYSERGRKTRMDNILGECRKQGVVVSEDTLERAFQVFARQSEVDYFINKNAQAFLQEQFNLWLYQYVFAGESEWTETRIKQLQTLKDIAFKIICFISQFEDELVKIWNKPKFVLSSNYVISLKTLKQLVSEHEFSRLMEIAVGEMLANRDYQHELAETIKEVYKEPLQNIYVDEVTFSDSKIELTYVKKFKSVEDAEDFSMRKWGSLDGIVRAGETEECVECYVRYDSERLVKEVDLNKIYIDTKFFPNSFKIELLDLISSRNNNLENVLDGFMVKSDNYHALKSLLPKFQEKVQLIYVDPPFNTEGSGFMYVDRFLDSSWLSMMRDRLSVAKDFLVEDGGIYLHLDHNANYYGRYLMDDIFGKDNLQREIVWNTSEVISGFKSKADNWIRQHDTILFYGKSRKPKFKKLWRLYKGDDETKDKFGWLDLIGEERSELYVERYAKDSARGIAKEPVGDHSVMRIGDVWNDILSLIYTQLMTRENWEFDNQKPENLLRRIIQSATAPRDFVMDFFAGSGTTIAAAHKLDRRWIGIEMGEYFEDTMLKRMKSVVFGDLRPFLSRDINWQGGGFFKYYELEQYEDTLRKAKYEDADLFDDPYRDPYNQYVFLRDLKMLEALEVDLEQDEVKVDLSKLYDNIDIVETLSNLRGKWIKKITPDPSAPLRARFVEFEDGERVDIKNLDYRLIKPLIWW